MEMIASPEMKEYFANLSESVKECYGLAGEARKKGLDPEEEVSIPLAKNMAERVVGLISVVASQVAGTKIPERILELEQKYGMLDWRVAFKIAEEVAKETFCKFETKQEAMETGIRIGFAYLTLGIVSAPLEGFIGLKIKKRKDGKEYFALQYAGPIRAAGGTAAATSVILSDYVRVKMGYDKYDPEEKEINRSAIEIQDYHERVTNLQYYPSEEEVKFMVSHLPVEVDGDPTEQIEVSNYKDLPRVETNMIRGGICLVLAEGLCQKTPKLWKRLSKWGKEMDLDWSFLGEFIKLKEKIHSAHAVSAALTSSDKKDEAKKKVVKPNNTFIMDLVAGRPILTHPLGVGGFRLRYGRTRTSGFSAASLHPATLIALDKYIAIGTQIKVERPGKAATVTVCDTLDGPIVRITDGSVLQLKTEAEAKKYVAKIEEIIFLGDILFNYGDFSENGQDLVPAGYCQEWWALEVEKAVLGKYVGERKNAKDFSEAINVLSQESSIEELYLTELIGNPLLIFPSFEEAVKISNTLNVPLHPDYTLYWKLISGPDLLKLLAYLSSGKIKLEENEIKKIVLSYFPQNEEVHKKAKQVMDFIGMPHQIINKDNLVIDKKEANVLALCFGFKNQEELIQLVNHPNLTEEQVAEKNGLEIINSLGHILLRDKAGTFIGARMGRPEKAKMRLMTGSPQALFPVGGEGDRLRSFQSAMEAGKVTSDFPLFYCLNCKKRMVYPHCEECKSKCVKQYYCKVCGELDKDICRHGKLFSHKEQEVDINYYFNKAKDRLGERLHPDLIKGIRGTSNKEHLTEHLAKGILRAKHNIYVNKDGTTRYDCTELPLTGFKPKEVKASVEKLRELGYTKDIYGKELIEPNQILELKPQDLILPGFNSLEESAPQVLLRVANFVDELLVRFYGLRPFYNLKKEEDLIGHLVIGLAPHISAGLIGRIVGFSETQGLLAHPMYHAGLRRDCVHPETRFVHETNSGEIKYDKIGPFVENLIAKGAKTSPIDGAGTLKVELKESEFFAFGVDPKNKKLKKKKIRYFIKGPQTKQWVKITTATNRTYTMTPTHDFMFWNGNSFQFKKAKDILIGDKIPILNKFINESKEAQSLTINLINFLTENVPDKELSNIYVINESFFKQLAHKHGRKKIITAIYGNISCDSLSRWYKNTPLLDVKKLIDRGMVNSNSLIDANTKIKIKFSERCFSPTLNLNSGIIPLLGYYAAEGHCRKTKTVSQVSFRIEDKDLQKIIIALISSTFNIIPNLGENSTKITICDQLVYLLFKFCFKAGPNAYEKKVPSILFNLPPRLIANYLSAFIDGDGSIVSQRNTVVLYSVSRQLLDDFSLLLANFKVFSKFQTTAERFPGKTVLEIYKRLGKPQKSHILHHLIINGKDTNTLKKILTLESAKKREKLSKLKIITSPRKTYFLGKQYLLEEKGDFIVDFVKKKEIVEDTINSYCFEVEWESKEDRNVLWGEQILNTRCDGDEACLLLLMDALLNFSRKFLPNSRGGVMDAPLVLTSTLYPTEIDDQVHGIDVAWQYPLELYEAALEMKKPWEVKFGPEQKKVPQLADRLGTPLHYEGFGFTHQVDNFNHGILCSAYKTLPTMEEKLFGQMEIARKVRAVDMDDVAKLVIQKHFLKDIRGNLRKFSMQQFRCVKCNEKFRRPPLSGKCSACGGKLIFTISEGSVVKYLNPSLLLMEKYNFSPYLKQTLELLKLNVDNVFGKEKDKQSGLGAFMQ